MVLIIEKIRKLKKKIQIGTKIVSNVCKNSFNRDKKIIKLPKNIQNVVKIIEISLKFTEKHKNCWNYYKNRSNEKITQKCRKTVAIAQKMWVNFELNALKLLEMCQKSIEISKNQLLT